MRTYFGQQHNKLMSIFSKNSNINITNYASKYENNDCLILNYSGKLTYDVNSNFDPANFETNNGIHIINEMNSKLNANFETDLTGQKYIKYTNYLNSIAKFNPPKTYLEVNEQITDSIPENIWPRISSVAYTINNDIYWADSNICNYFVISNIELTTTDNSDINIHNFNSYNLSINFPVGLTDNVGTEIYINVTDLYNTRKNCY